MDTLFQDLMVGVASNGLWALVANATVAGVQALKDSLSKNSEIDRAVQEALASISEVYPLGSGPARARLVSAIRSPEVESVIRQLYAADLLGQSSSSALDSIR